jgi:diguanylate cyclase (GGDEF)-like protein
MKNKLLVFSEISLFVIVAIIIFFTGALVSPAVPLKIIIKKILPFLLVTYFFLFLSLRIINFYYNQLLEQKRLIENLNDDIINLVTEIKLDPLMKRGLQTLMRFCAGHKGLFLLLDEKLKRYASGEVIAININPPKYESRRQSNYRLLTFFPGDIKNHLEKKVRELLQKYDFEKCKAIVVIPIREDNKTRAIGIIGSSMTAADSKANKIYQDLKNIIGIFIEQFTIQMENAILHEEINEASITDPLTSLYNRRYFTARIKEEFSRAKRKGFPVSIMISDLDNFKYYVDTYGHPRGDEILTQVGSIVKNSMRESDVACRFGGDEFAYLLPFTSSSEAELLGERIKKNVTDNEFFKTNFDRPLNLTMSIGIASYPEHSKGYEETLSKADSALFTAKNEGKNRITIYKEGQE